AKIRRPACIRIIDIREWNTGIHRITRRVEHGSGRTHKRRKGRRDRHRVAEYRLTQQDTVSFIRGPLAQRSKSIPAIVEGKLSVWSPPVEVDPGQLNGWHHIDGVLCPQRQIIHKGKIRQLIAVLDPPPSGPDGRVVKDVKAARIQIEFVGSFGGIVDEISEGVHGAAPDRLKADSHTDVAESIAERPHISLAIVQLHPVITAPENIVAVKIDGAVRNRSVW